MNANSGTVKTKIWEARQLLGAEHPAVKEAESAYRVEYSGPDSYGKLPEDIWDRLYNAVEAAKQKSA